MDHDDKRILQLVQAAHSTKPVITLCWVSLRLWGHSNLLQRPNIVHVTHASCMHTCPPVTPPPPTHMRAHRAGLATRTPGPPHRNGCELLAAVLLCICAERLQPSSRGPECVCHCDSCLNQEARVRVSLSQLSESVGPGASLYSDMSQLSESVGAVLVQGQLVGVVAHPSVGQGRGEGGKRAGAAGDRQERRWFCLAGSRHTSQCGAAAGCRT